MLALQAINRIKKNKPVSVFTSLSLVKRKYNIEYRSDRIIAVSNSVEEMLLKKFRLSSKKVAVINNFTDTDEIHELEIISPLRDHWARPSGAVTGLLSNQQRNFGDHRPCAGGAITGELPSQSVIAPRE